MSAAPDRPAHGLAALPPLPQPRGPLARLRRFHIHDVAVCGAFAAIFAMALRPVVDNDLFWHLATGRYMWTTGRIPHADPFSWTAAGRAWIAHEWLTEWWLYPLFQRGGYAALMLVFAAIITAAFAVSYLTARRLGASRLLGLVITILAAVASSHTWGVRPQMLSMLLMAVTLYVLTAAVLAPRRAEGARHICDAKYLAWALPLLMVLWANLHGGFIFGLALIGIFALGQSVHLTWSRLTMRPSERGEGTLRTQQNPPLWRLLAAATATCVLNPNGLKGLLYPFSYLGNNASTRYIAEWVSPDFHQLQYQFFEALLLALLVGTLFAPRRSRAAGLPGLTQILLILSFTYLALGSVRNINLFAVIVAPLIAAYLSAAWCDLRAQARAPRPATPTPRRLQAVPPAKAMLNLALAGVIVGAVLVISAPSLTAAHNEQAQARRFPAGAVAYLRRQRPSGRLFNSYDWGGYLIWRLYPRVRVYVDGRPDMYGDRFMDLYVRTWQAQPGWQYTLRQGHVRLVLVEPGSGLGRALAGARGWRVAYHDAVSVLYERTA